MSAPPEAIESFTMRRIKTNLTVSFVPWNEGGEYVMRDEEGDMVICVTDTANLFKKDTILDRVREGDERTLHIKVPTLEQKPRPSLAGGPFLWTPVLTCFMLDHGQLVVGEDEFALTQRDTYPAFSRLLEGSLCLTPGMRFHVWFTCSDNSI